MTHSVTVQYPQELFEYLRDVTKFIDLLQMQIDTTCNQEFGRELSGTLDHFDAIRNDLLIEIHGHIELQLVEDSHK